MDDSDKSLLEFKRMFFIENLASMKKNHNNPLANCDRAKTWCVTFWFGALILIVQKDGCSSWFSLLLLFEVFVFYGLDFYFRVLARRSIKRIGDMEKWVLTATAHDVLRFEETLASVVKRITRRD